MKGGEEMRVLVNLDFDGVVIPNTLEGMFFKRMETHGYDIDWYCKFINTHTEQPLNTSLLNFFDNNKDKFALRLWTNRNYTIKKETFKTLGPYVSVFDSFSFNDGLKINRQVEGIVIDNDSKYLACGQRGILYNMR
jgi:hypothetical protein